MSLLQTISGLVDRHLGEDSAAALRARYLRLKDEGAPLIRAVRGTFSVDKLRAHLADKLGEDFDILFVHSSLNGLQPMYTGHALSLVRMLMDFVGPQRTLAMPAFYFGDSAIGGAGKTFAANPVFDLRRTPSQMGLPSELFRRSPGVLQSRNPVYRIAALGPRAAELTTGHETTETLCGRGTLFDTMANADALILGIGKPFEVLTQVHHAEQLLGDAFPVPRNTNTALPMTLIEGKTHIPYLLPRTGLGWRRDMWRLRAIMTPATLREWSFHGAPMFATRAGEVSRAITAAAARGETIHVKP